VAQGRLGGGAGNRPSRLVLRLSAAAAALAALLIALTVAVAAGPSHIQRVAAPRPVPVGPAGTTTGVLAATIVPDPALLHDGDGVATVALADVSSTDVPVRRLRTTIRVSAPARAAAVRSASGWHCTVYPDGTIECRPTPAVVRSSAVVPIKLFIRATGTRGHPLYGRANLVVRGAWTQPGPDGRALGRSSTASLAVDERPPLTVTASSVERTAIDPVKGVPTTPTILQSSVGRRTPEPISFEWRQLCGSGACPRVNWTTPTSGLLLGGQQPEASFTAPHVDRALVLRFELTASDPRGPVSAVASVRVEPDQIERINPRLRSVALAGGVLRSSQRANTALALTKADQATVDVGAPGAYQTRVGGLVLLDARVGGQRVSRASWKVAVGPTSMLAGAVRSGPAIRFRAPSVPGTYAVRMTAATAAGSFTRDELIEVDPAVAASADVGGAVAARADVASAGTGRERAFCAVLAAAREHGRISISLPSGGTFTAETSKPAGAGCSGSETIAFHGGSTTLGSFELTAVRGEITRDRGLVISGGTVLAPSFWGAKPESAADTNVHVVHGTLASQAAHPGGGLAIGFEVPRTAGISVGIGIPLTDGGFGDLVGAVTVDQSALDKLPLASSLPGGWKMSSISLSVAPDARRFELDANAKGPASTGGELSFYGVLTFDGQVSVSVVGSNLAVFQSGAGQQATLKAEGTLTLLPGRHFDPANPNATGSYFPVIDVSVSAAIDNYRPAQNLTLSGQVSWSSSGPLEIEGTLVTDVKGNDIRATVSGSFEDASNWRLFASLETAPAGLSIGNPELLKLKLLEGELTRRSGQLSVRLKGEASDIRVIAGLDVKSAKVEFTTDCQFRGEQTAPTPGSRLCLLIDSTLDLTVPGAPTPLRVTGGVKLDLKTLKFEADGGLSAGEKFGPDQFKLHDVKLFVTNATPSTATCNTVARAATADGLSFGFTAKGEVLGLHLNITGAYLGGNQKHFCLGAEIGGASLPTGDSDRLSPMGAQGPASCARPESPTLQALRFDYSSDTEIGRFSGKFCFPSGIREKLGTVGTGVGTVDLYLSRDGFEASASYSLGDRVAWFINARDQNTPDPAKAALGFRSMSVRVWATTTKGLGIGIDAGGEISLPAPTSSSGGTGAGSRAPLDVGVEASLRPAPQLSFTAVVGGQRVGKAPAVEPCNAATAKIKDVFGSAGFNICQFGLQGTIGASGVGLGVNAKFTLPTEWGNRLGVKNASLEIGFNISAQTPCLDLSIKRANSNPDAPPALDLFDKGVITTNSADLVIAPNGCVLPGKEPTPAGIHLAFDGTLFGTATKIDLKITRQPAGLKIQYTQRTGASALGPLKFGATAIDVLLEPGPPAQSKLELHTSMTIGDRGGVLIDGVFNHAAGRTTLDASACLITALPPVGAPSDQRPACGEVNVFGARFSGSVHLKFETGTGGTKAEFSGNFAADLRFLKFEVTVTKLRYEAGLQELDMNASTGFKIGGVAGHIGGSVDYSRAGARLKLGLAGYLDLWGFKPAFNISKDFSTNIRLPFSFGPGANTTRISEPRSLLVLRLDGKLDGHVDPDGAVVVDHKLPIQACFPFETVCVDVDKEARVNTANGTVKFKVFGYDVTIDASKYIKHEPGQVDFSPGISYVANDFSGKCLDVKNAHFLNGTPLHAADCSKTRNIAQEFKLLADGTLRVRNSEGKEFCVRGVATGGGPELQLAGCDINQSGVRWYRNNLGQIKGGYANHGHLCLDIRGHSNQAGALYTLDGCRNGAKSQRWVIVDLIRHPASPRVGCLDVPRGNLMSELMVFGDCNRTVNQAFALYPNGELKVRGQCVAAEIRTGARLRLENCSGAPTQQQRWSLNFGQLCVGETDVPGSAPGSGGDFRQARCMAPLAKQGDFFPVELRPFNEKEGTQKWDVTY
jgi:hypothetical protein